MGNGDSRRDADGYIEILLVLVLVLVIVIVIARWTIQIWMGARWRDGKRVLERDNIESTVY